MALTYYIRSWDPRSTYPTNPQEGDICYTITLDQTWAPVGGVKKDNIVKEEVYQNGAWVEQGGGGGGTKIYEGSISTTLTEDGYAISALESMLVTIPDADLPESVTAEFKSNTYTLNLDADLLADQGIAQYGEFDSVTRDPVFTNIPIAFFLSEGESPEARENIRFMTAAAETDEAVVVTGEIG